MTVAVGVAVAVAVAVLVGEPVDVGVAVGVLVAVAVADGEPVAVAVGVGLGPPHTLPGDAELRAAGVTAEKSVELLSVSVQPEPALRSLLYSSQPPRLPRLQNS